VFINRYVQQQNDDDDDDDDNDNDDDDDDDDDNPWSKPGLQLVKKFPAFYRT